MGNLDNNDTTFEAHLMSLRFKDKEKDKSYDKNSQGLQLIQPGRIEATNGNGPIQPNLQAEINVLTANESMDIPQLSNEQVRLMEENRAKYRSRVHYRPKEQKALEENDYR